MCGEKLPVVMESYCPLDKPLCYLQEPNAVVRLQHWPVGIRHLTSDPVKAHLNFGSPVKMKGLKKANVALQGDPTEGALFYLRRP